MVWTQCVGVSVTNSQAFPKARAANPLGKLRSRLTGRWTTHFLEAKELVTTKLGMKLDDKSSAHTAASAKAEPMLVSFPSGAPKPHQAQAWGRALDSAITLNGLTHVARGKLPPGRFRKPHSAAMLKPPPKLPRTLASGTSWLTGTCATRSRSARRTMRRSRNRRTATGRT